MKEPELPIGDLGGRGETRKLELAVALLLSLSNYWQVFALVAACLRRCLSFLNRLVFS